MAATRDVASVVADERCAAVALTQLAAVAHMTGAVHWFAVSDADEWSAVLVLAGPDAKRGIAVAKGLAADTIELRFGSVTIHVQGPTRRETLDDWRRLRALRESEEG